MLWGFALRAAGVAPLALSLHFLEGQGEGEEMEGRTNLHSLVLRTGKHEDLVVVATVSLVFIDVPHLPGFTLVARTDSPGEVSERLPFMGCSASPGKQAVNQTHADWEHKQAFCGTTFPRFSYPLLPPAEYGVFGFSPFDSLLSPKALAIADSACLVAVLSRRSPAPHLRHRQDKQLRRVLARLSSSRGFVRFHAYRLCLISPVKSVSISHLIAFQSSLASNFGLISITNHAIMSAEEDLVDTVS
uniref:Secreted protein n=1 Tax=Panagrellus redivivus TaxID=6233 RepID=A0A7E4VUJ1_PANRE